MTWYFLRHAETAANVGRRYNPLDDPLTPAGKEQALAAAAFVKGLRLDAVFCSPLARAVETARLIGLRPVLAPELADRSFGEFAGRSVGSIRAYCVQHGFDPDAFVPAGGESLDDLRSRALAFVTALPRKSILFVTHSDVIAGVVEAVTGEAWSAIRPENCALWVFEDGTLVHRNWRPWENDI